MSSNSGNVISSKAQLTADLYDLSKFWGQSYGSPYRAAMYDGFVNE